MKVEITVVEGYDKDIQMKPSDSLAIMRGEYGAKIYLAQASSCLGEPKYLKSECDVPVIVVPHADDWVKEDIVIQPHSMVAIISAGNGWFVIG